MKLKTNKMKKDNFEFPRQYGYMSSAVRAINNYEKKHGKQRFSINQLDENCFEVNIHPIK